MPCPVGNSSPDDIRERVQRLVVAMELLAKGNLHACVEEGPEGWFIDLERAFNHLFNSISSRIKELERLGIFLKNLIDSSVDGIIASDMQGNILPFNHAAENLLGYRQQEVIGRLHISKLYPQGMGRSIVKMARISL